MSKRMITTCMIIMMTIVLGLTGCGQQKNTAEQNKILRVGSETTFAPFEFQDEKTKEYVGFDIDLMKAIGKQIGKDVEIVSMGFDGLIPALNAGNIDAAISGMTITDERKEKVVFSDSYYKSGLSAVVKSDNAVIQGFKDLEGRKIAVQIGTTGAMEAKKIPGAVIREFNNAPEAFMELQAGGVEAVVNDKPVSDYFLMQNAAKYARSLDETLTSEDYGIAFDKKNVQLAQEVDKALSELKLNGEYDKIYEKWFGNQKQ